MAASREDISGWFDEAKAKGATHMIVCCDTYDWEDYPKNIMPGENPRDFKPGSMQKVMEVYAMHLPKDDQMRAGRAFNYDMP